MADGVFRVESDLFQQFFRGCFGISRIFGVLFMVLQTADFVVRAFTSEKYSQVKCCPVRLYHRDTKRSQIPEFITFEDRLDNSLQRDVVKVEHTRMRLTHEPVTSEIIDMELVELKFIFDRGMCTDNCRSCVLQPDNGFWSVVHHDNRDFNILPNYQPRIVPSFHQHTLLFKKSAGVHILVVRFQPWLTMHLL